MTAAPVVAWELCSWCQVMVPTPHACPASGPTCPTETGEHCGMCETDLRLQQEDLAAQAAVKDALHGSPSDLDHP